MTTSLSSSISALALICALFAAQSSASLFDFSWMKKDNNREWAGESDYDLLNSELVNNVNDDAPLSNVLAALDWLKMASGEMELDPHLELPGKEALIRFTALIKLMDPDNPHCNIEAYKILKDNEIATGTDISMPTSELGALRRIEEVVHQVAVDHAVQCRYEYPSEFIKALAGAPKKIIKDIRKMMDPIIATSKRLVFVAKNRYTDPRQLAAAKAQSISMRGQSEATALLLHLRDVSEHDRDNRHLSVKPDPRRRNRYIVNEPKVVELMERYVYSRCGFLEENFGHIMKPAIFDQEIFDRHNKYRAINERTAEFMIWLQYYNICQDIMQNKQALEDNVIKAIWSELS